MKKTIFFITTLSLLVFYSQITLSQDIDHIRGGRFLKRVEHNIVLPGEDEESFGYNLQSKSVIERMFFGKTNSFVEFVFKKPFGEKNGAFALRIIKSSQSDSIKMEIMTMDTRLDFDSIKEELTAKANKIILTQELLGSTPDDLLNKINMHNNEAIFSIYSDGIFKPYHPEPKVFFISNEFAEKLHNKVSALIKNFTSEGIPVGMFDGKTAIFRCIVGNEVWMLNIHVPQKRALQLSRIFMQMINTYDGTTDESEYIELLNQIEL